MRRVAAELDWEPALEPAVIRITRMRLEVMDCLVQAVADAGHPVDDAQRIVAEMWELCADMMDTARALQVASATGRRPPLQ